MLLQTMVAVFNRALVQIQPGYIQTQPTKPKEQPPRSTSGFKDPFHWDLNILIHARNKKVEFGHNPFSMPKGGMEALENEDPLSIDAMQYDMVCNGYEIASGGIRNHLPETMVKAFEITGLSQEVVEERFGGLYRAFQYGAPPHGGMAAGVDRIVMLLCGTKNLREITMFPMNQQAKDLLMGAPGEVDKPQLKELHLRLNLPRET